MADVCFAEGTWPCAGGDDGFHPRKGTGKETEEESGELRGLDVSERVVAPTKPPPDRGLGEEVTPGPPAAPAGPDGLLGSNGSVGFPNRSTTGFIQMHTIAATPSRATKVPRMSGSFIILFMFIGFRIPNRYENEHQLRKLQRTVVARNTILPYVLTDIGTPLSVLFHTLSIYDNIVLLLLRFLL